MAKLPNDPDLMARTVIDIASASFTNARALLTSARAVLDGHQWPTSFSIGALALEEIGKGALCMTLLIMSPADREEFRPAFDKAFTNHQTKAEFAHLVLAMAAEKVPASLEQLAEEAIASARQTNAVKFRGLYVDYTDAGALLKPDDSIDEAAARQMIAVVTAALADAEYAEAAVADPDAYLASRFHERARPCLDQISGECL
ncbi:AbiV family abortive infection protein [Streptomyces sp. H27-D2]|uniref:AbiV family abortive infection protein n=1 Tax=Streptomyces sp. H27-D2 TaxID=3046304 RepID=UPI002DB8540C|nr:AbiV family abortive infection protein [Streptomyces sp. H27-D2]MEC4015720.1 AbiV family abortive infection protein [Streptomyces sp. H27-D2]